MSTCYSNRKRDFSPQIAEGQQASETFIPWNWHSHSSWRLTFRSINPQHTHAAQDQSYSSNADHSTRQHRVREQDVSRNVASAQRLMLCHASSLEEEQSRRSGAFQLKAFAVLYPSNEPVLYLNSKPTALREATRLWVFPSRDFVLWPDYWIATKDETFYNHFRPYSNGYRRGLAKQPSF